MTGRFASWAEITGARNSVGELCVEEAGTLRSASPGGAHPLTFSEKVQQLDNALARIG